MKTLRLFAKKFPTGFVAIGLVVLVGTIIALATTGAFADGDLGAAMDRLAATSEKSFTIIDVIIYVLGVVVLIGGFLTLRNGRQTSNPGAIRGGMVAICIGLAILGWKGLTDAFYSTVGIDETGSGYQRPHM